MRKTVYGYMRPNSGELYLYRDSERPIIAEVIAFDIRDDRALVYIHTTNEYITLHTHDFLLTEFSKPNKTELLLYGKKNLTTKQLLDKWLDLNSPYLKFKSGTPKGEMAEHSSYGEEIYVGLKR